MAYESPISMLIEDMLTEVREKQDQLILDACQKVGVKVDKEELRSALAYDRKQYERGYEDGYRAGVIEGLGAAARALKVAWLDAGGKVEEP